MRCGLRIAVLLGLLSCFFQECSSTIGGLNILRTPSRRRLRSYPSPVNMNWPVRRQMPMDNILVNNRPEQNVGPGHRCNLPHGVEGGPKYCMAILLRWTFNSETGLCEEFSYGGCGGNSNRFNTAAECQRACSSFAKNNGNTKGGKSNWPGPSQKQETPQSKWPGSSQQQETPQSNWPGSSQQQETPQSNWPGLSQEQETPQSMWPWPLPKYPQETPQSNWPGSSQQQETPQSNWPGSSQQQEIPQSNWPDSQQQERPQINWPGSNWDNSGQQNQENLQQFPARPVQNTNWPVRQPNQGTPSWRWLIRSGRTPGSNSGGNPRILVA